MREKGERKGEGGGGGGGGGREREKNMHESWCLLPLSCTCTLYCTHKKLLFLYATNISHKFCKQTFCYITHQLSLQTHVQSHIHKHSYCNSYLTVIVVHEIHGRMHHNHCQITILLAHDPPFITGLPYMMTHTL